MKEGILHVDARKSGAQRGAVPDESHFDFDVFISYSSLDRDWVRGELLTRIEQTGLKAYIDFRDFTRGAPSIKECERGVEKCRRTLVVLTPNYIKSEWAEIEMIMVQTLSPANRDLRLIPLLKACCNKPRSIETLTHIDFTDNADRDLAWRQLYAALSRTTAPAKAEMPGGHDAQSTIRSAAARRDSQSSAPGRLSAKQKWTLLVGIVVVATGAGVSGFKWLVDRTNTHNGIELATATNNQELEEATPGLQTNQSGKSPLLLPDAQPRQADSPNLPAPVAPSGSYYVVTIFLPSSYYGADLFVDGHRARLIEQLPSSVTLHIHGLDVSHTLRITKDSMPTYESPMPLPSNTTNFTFNPFANK